MTDLAPYEPSRPPERRGGEGPAELWRRANAATKGTIVSILAVVLVVAAFLTGRWTAPGENDPETAAGAAPAPARTEATPQDVERARADDETAKAVALDLVTFVESCAAGSQDQDYAQCRTTAQLNVGSTIPLVDGRQPRAGEAAVTTTRRDFRVVSVSASGNTFSVSRDGAADPVQTCTDSGVPGAGCAGGVW